MLRTDYFGPAPPAHIQKVLRTTGGLTRTGVPKYRLVCAPYRLAPAGGRWVDWDEQLTVSERKEGERAPLRVTCEVRMSPRYPTNQTGWVLEKWCPPEDYGTPEKWYSPQVTGGTMLWLPEDMKYMPALGEYPSAGDFEHIGYCFPNEALTCVVVETAVGRFEQGLASMPSTPKGRVQRAVYLAKLMDEQKRAASKRHALDMLNETDFAFGSKPWSGGYGPKRSNSVNEFAKKAGVTSHIR